MINDVTIKVLTTEELKELGCTPDQIRAARRRQKRYYPEYKPGDVVTYTPEQKIKWRKKPV